MKRGELEARRALLYAPLPPRLNKRHRPVSWTKARAIAALRTLDEQPHYNDWRKTPPGMPSRTTLTTLFGSWNAAMEAAGWRPRPRGYAEERRGR